MITTSFMFLLLIIIIIYHFISITFECRGFGVLEYKQNKSLPPEEQMITAYPDIVIENLSKDVQFIVIACDGVWDCMTNQEVCSFVGDRLKKDPKMRLSKIIEEIFETILAPDIYTGNTN